jgi:multidrug efflux pump subunit AcrA (membrane-fusion protein)
MIVSVFAVAGFGYWLTTPAKAQRTDLILHTVHLEPLNLTVVERGALESADNREVTCRVKAGNKTQSLTIKWVIDDGAQVKQGERLMEIDDSALQDALKAEKILFDQAKAAWIGAEETYKIQISQNETDIKSAEVVLQLAKIDLEKYQKGDYPQSLKDVEGQIKIAESDVEQQRDRAAWAQRMVKKGYQTVSQAQAEQSKLESMEITLASKIEAKRVLTDDRYGMKERTETDLRNKVAEAERALARAKLQAAAKEIQADSTRQTAKSVFEQEQDKYEDIEEQIRKCVITSPQDGMVVYYVSEQSRYGSGSQQSIIAQGEPVKEGQKLMRIPDLRRMLVNTKVHEAMVSRIKGDIWQPTGFVDALRAAMMFNTDGLSRLSSQHAVADIRERMRDYEMKRVSDGMRATIRIDAFHDHILQGHVKSVATVASQQDWMTADVKLYQTMVAIDESREGLKPGMSAEVTIYVEGTGEQVLTVPLQAVVGGAEMGRLRKLFVMDGTTPRERDVTLGLSNEKVVEVRDGLKEGEVVVLNPRVLVGDKVKTRQAGDVDRGVTTEGGSGGKGKGKGKNRGPGKGFPKGDEGMPPMDGPGGPGGPGGGPGGFPPNGRPGK